MVGGEHGGGTAPSVDSSPDGVGGDAGASGAVLLVHGGASDEAPPDALEAAEQRRGLRAALDAGWLVLESGGAALDAVEAAVRVLEDHPSFNAGTGAVTTSAGTVERDAAIMDGHDGRSGAVAVSTEVRNPVVAARAVLEHSEHVLLAGHSVDVFARAHGIELVEPSTGPSPVTSADHGGGFGTVGAVAVDLSGRLAAATSTGGLEGQAPGRVSDSAVLGAGTWADRRVAISATGDGEAIARAVAAHRVALRHEVMPLSSAVTDALDQVAAAGGSAGLIAVDSEHRCCALARTTLFRRGHRDGRGASVALFTEEALSSLPSGDGATA